VKNQKLSQDQEHWIMNWESQKLKSMNSSPLLSTMKMLFAWRYIPM